MEITRYLSVLAVLLLVGCKVQSDDQRVEKGRSSRPNIVFLFTDDQTYETIRALGNGIIQTPNLDRLVHNGSAFTHAYNMGGWHGAVCVASRSMIISGRYIWRARQQEDLWKRNDTTAIGQTWGRLMSQHGYNTYMSGKWHIQAPVESVFGNVKHERPGMPPDAWGRGGAKKVIEAVKNDLDIDDAMPPGYNRPRNEDDDSWSPSDPVFGGYWEGGRHWSEVVKYDALDFIAEATGKDDPFFMYLAFNAPHDPRQSPREFIDKYPLGTIPVPENFLPEYPWKDSIGNSRLLRDETLAPYPRTGYAVKKHRQEYYAIISHLDEQIGAILNALEASGAMDNTYVFFASDHGLSLGQHGLMGKQSLFDHSIRVPLLLTGPGVPKGKRFDQDVYLQDIMPTSLELAGIEKPGYVEFNSFLDIIKGERKESHYGSIYGCYMDYQRMIRKDGYKLLVYPRIRKILLFDLRKDPKEINNLADRPEHSALVKRMFNDLVDLQKRMGDDLDLTKTFQAL